MNTDGHGLRWRRLPPDLCEVPVEEAARGLGVVDEIPQRPVDGDERVLGDKLSVVEPEGGTNAKRVSDEDEGEGPGEPVPGGGGMAGCVGGFGGVRHEFHELTRRERTTDEHSAAKPQPN